MALTRRHAHTSCLGVANGLSSGFGNASSLPPRAGAPVDRFVTPDEPPLGSTTTPASSGFPATTGRSAAERRDRYSMPTAFCPGTLPLTTSGPTTPDAVSTLAFSRSVQEPQTRTPGQDFYPRSHTPCPAYSLRPTAFARQRPDGMTRCATSGVVHRPVEAKRRREHFVCGRERLSAPIARTSASRAHQGGSGWR